MGGGYTTIGASLNVPNVGFFLNLSRIKVENLIVPIAALKWI
jgi:hypothetical protein